MILEVTDEVEIGHNQYCGGSTKISIKVLDCPSDNKVENQIKYQLLDSIDTLDHSMVIDDIDAKNVFKRYYITENNLRYSFHYIVAVILYRRLDSFIVNNHDIEITIEWDKVKCTYTDNELMDYHFIKEMFNANESA